MTYLEAVQTYESLCHRRDGRRCAGLTPNERTSLAQAKEMIRRSLVADAAQQLWDLLA